jgi:hypothetical protein
MSKNKRQLLARGNLSGVAQYEKDVRWSIEGIDSLATTGRGKAA